MSAPTWNGTDCLHCKGTGYVGRVVCRECHGDGCHACDGTGVVAVQGQRCRHCHGTGLREWWTGPEGWNAR